MPTNSSKPQSALKPGMRVMDNDPRLPNRVMVVHAIEKTKAVLRHPTLPGKTYETRVSLNRIHTDGKVRRSGWSLVLCDSTPTQPRKDGLDGASR